MTPSRSRSRTEFLSCLAALAVAALTGTVYAQPSSAQQNALRQSCRSDFMSHCSGVTPGGQEALACLQKNVGSLSPACRQAVNAIMPAPAAQPKAAAAPPAKPKPNAKPKTAPAVAAPAAAEPTTVAEPAPGATPQQLGAINFTCGRDFSLHCKGITPGGPEALTCLRQNEQELAPDCKIALADIADLMPTAAVQTAAPATAPPAAGARAKPVAPVASAVVVGRACLRDLALHCRGTGIGEGEKIACLKAYAASGKRLSVLCEAALKITPMR